MATLVDDSGTTRFEGTIEGAGVPVADPSVASFDGTTYTNPWTGVGKIETLVLASDSSVVALAITGDAFPRLLLTANTLYFGDGTADPTAGPGLFYDAGLLGATTGLKPVAAAIPAAAATLGQVSPKGTVTSGPLATQAIVSGAGVQLSTARDVTAYTSMIPDGTVNQAITSVFLSPDNVTYTLICEGIVDAALSSTIPLTVRVPAGWYVKFTLTSCTLIGNAVTFA